MKYGKVGSGSGILAMAAIVGVMSLGLAPAANAAVSTPQGPSGRFRVLVIPLQATVVDKKFGQKVSQELDKRLEDFSTHTPVSEKEYKRALKRYDVKESEINAIKARQLGKLMGAQVVFFGTVTQLRTGFEANASFIDVPTGDEVKVPPVEFADKSDASVQKIADAAATAFGDQVRFLRARRFCADYVGSQQPENALRNCNEALAINANSTHVLFNKGLAFRLLFEKSEGGDGSQEWADSAIFYFQKVLELNPGHRDAMQNAAYIYSQIGNAEKASELYRDYLELDPANVPVRLKVAYDMAQAGLMAEAIKIVQDGLEYAPDDVDLLQTLGDYALRYSDQDSTYVDIALSSYEKVLEIKGEETDPSIINNTIAAYTRAGRSAEAVAFAEKALESHSDSPQLWSLYADALARMERYADAAAAMDKALELDPAYPRGYLKRGRLKLQAGDEAGANADFSLAIKSGSSTSSDVFLVFWGQAHQLRNKGELRVALKDFERGSQFVPPSKRQELEFWWGYTCYQLGERTAKNEKATVAQLRRAQTDFQCALQHFNKAGSVKKEIPGLKDGSDKWLLNVEARIKQLTRS